MAAATLRGVSLSVRQGECLALLGRNGVGKTTLLKCLMGVLPVARGGVSLDGADITRLAPHQRRARHGLCAAGARHLRAADGRREHTDGHGDCRPRARRIKEEVFELFPVLRGMLSRRGGDLSGGQQQQLAIARALVAEPRLIILDEPTEGIQPSIIKDIGRVIRMLRQRGDIGILLCEQYFDFARELADRYMVLSRGEVVASGGRETMDGEDVRRHLSV